MVDSAQSVAEIPAAAVQNRPSAGDGRLWTRAELAAYLQCSTRSIDRALVRDAAQGGSIPHVVMFRGRPTGRQDVRFIPEEIRVWLNLNCPPAAGIYEMRQKSLATPRRRGAY